MFRHIFPCHNAPGEPRHKQPLTPNGFRAASDDPAVIADWKVQYPGCLWGWWAGADGFTVIDIDLKRGKKGEETWATLEAEHGDFVETRTHRTESGGRHLIFDGTVDYNGELGRDIDVRSMKGYVILPGPGNGYTVTNDRAPAPMPEWIQETITAKISLRGQLRAARKAPVEAIDWDKPITLDRGLTSWRTKPSA